MMLPSIICQLITMMLTACWSSSQTLNYLYLHLCVLIQCVIFSGRMYWVSQSQHAALEHIQWAADGPPTHRHTRFTSSLYGTLFSDVLEEGLLAKITLWPQANYSDG